VAEGGGLLNRCTASSRTVSSNLIPSASNCNFQKYSQATYNGFQVTCADLCADLQLLFGEKRVPLHWESGSGRITTDDGREIGKMRGAAESL
jgi:hypothetical protein